ncbi:MAG TPA: hypothetical protein VGS41_06905, partial [Chthonomonadales bacterium]|nr:hypothetical protein [Chthonomonadales bacterium]
RQKGLRGLREYWSGKAAYVTHALHAPGSGPGCWANEAYPNWNRQDVIEISPDDVPEGVPLTFEAYFYMTDARRGPIMGLSRPFEHDGEKHQYHIALVQVRPLGISAGGILRPAPVHACRWHQLRVDCDLDRQSMRITLDHCPVLPDGPMADPATPSRTFTHFVISGSNFLQEIA